MVKAVTIKAITMCFRHLFFQTRSMATFKQDICSQNDKELKAKSMLIAMETRVKKISYRGQRLLTVVYKLVNLKETDRCYQ